jgi:magnesium transporter
MIYLSRMLGKPVVDAAGGEIGTISDIAIATGEIFPRVTALAFLGPEKTPFMLSWRKYVEVFDGERIVLNDARAELRFSYLQPDEILLHRDLLNKQIVDTQGMKVVRVNDLKLSDSRNQLRLLGAEVGTRGLLRGIAPSLERFVVAITRAFGRELPEEIIAWNYMDLVERDLSQVKLSVTHRRLHELHPADMADVLEQLTPSQRAKVFAHLDNDQAAETLSEMEDEVQADVIEDLSSERASDILEIMDPDDAADIIGDLPYEKAEALLRLMGVKEARQVRKLLGYKEKTAGGIMTPEVTTVTEDMTVQQVIDHLRGAARENENIYYIYVVGPKDLLEGVISLRDLIVSPPETKVADIVERDLFKVGVDDDQEDVADMMSKYDLLALPVVDETGRILGIVTVDDALDVLDEEAEEDLALAGGPVVGMRSAVTGWVGGLGDWITAWLFMGVGAALALRFLGGAGVTAAVDETGRILGIVTVDDALDVLDEEAEEAQRGGDGRDRRGVRPARDPPLRRDRVARARTDDRGRRRREPRRLREAARRRPWRRCRPRCGLRSRRARGAPGPPSADSVRARRRRRAHGRGARGHGDRAALARAPRPGGPLARVVRHDHCADERRRPCSVPLARGLPRPDRGVETWLKR